MKNLLFFSLALITFLPIKSFAQSQDDVYNWNWKKDGIWLGSGIVGSGAGLLLISEKTGFTELEIQNLDKNDVFVVDRWAAGNFSENASANSDIPFYTSFALPFTLLLDKSISKESATVVGLYFESMLTTSALFTITAGLTNRARPYVYDNEAPLDKRLSTSATRSFYSGHVASSATALVFMAKVYSDFHPNSSFRHVLWASAIVIPASVGYFRIKAGQHFLTDVLLGYSLGALSGYLIPELHKSKSSKISINPTFGVIDNGESYSALSLKYTF